MLIGEVARHPGVDENPLHAGAYLARLPEARDRDQLGDELQVGKYKLAFLSR